MTNINTSIGTHQCLSPKPSTLVRQAASEYKCSAVHFKCIAAATNFPSTTVKRLDGVDQVNPMSEVARKRRASAALMRAYTLTFRAINHFIAPLFCDISGDYVFSSGGGTVHNDTFSSSLTTGDLILNPGPIDMQCRRNDFPFASFRVTPDGQIRNMLPINDPSARGRVEIMEGVLTMLRQCIYHNVRIAVKDVSHNSANDFNYVVCRVALMVVTCSTTKAAVESYVRQSLSEASTASMR